MSDLQSDRPQSGRGLPPEKGLGDERHARRDWRKSLGLRGETAGTAKIDGQVLAWGLTTLAAVVALVNTLDVITIAHNEPEIGIAGPILWEFTGGITILPAALIPWFLMKALPLDRRPFWLTALVYVAAAPVFSTFHVASMVALRMLAYWAMGARYLFGPVLQNFEYEASKDIFGYVGAILAFWSARRLLTLRSPTPQPGARLLDIRDGATLIRVKMDDILAVTSAGNYVEFALRDGRRPLMRKPLSTMEAELASDGFVRVHRSWLVNAMQVTGLKPEGSGDYTVEIGTLSVPLSRRFPDALAKLRAG